ncbi:toxin co-regulated pilus biosynthesis Q family protein [Escherichia coli]|uniref:toxin co-regulated pilus biosynthesis Q family protein n=1 Tax=Escherichia coli TaxID=562 RepID=UPI0019F7D182|nr:toxin co-regulated pilus biosynthesis Q family protein [Escherichia coli]EGJ2728623.1 pilus assembly protein PilL [Escherichia coli]EGQ2051192.1 pilus assembly protein PilL [Escherichia coli]EHT2210732.1 toxin co-regulated pilus biosynthesis Q family protein [Escherichia coli]EIN1917255.1 toxin co-regulated pilus biosynthesis Q family protein [Escherichia coli]EJN6512830.1 toxin co-regulated pilus biosynthesis Q family protein [Escherichia coli]
MTPLKPLLIVPLLAFSVPLFAAPSPSQVSAPSSSTVSSAPGALKFIPRDGKGLSLKKAMQQLIPPGWTFDIAPDVRPPRTVSWKGNDQWNYVTERMLKKYQLRAITDTEKKHVRIERNTLFSPSQAPPGTTSLQEKTAEKSANMPQPAHARTTWTLARGTLLRAGLEQWVAAVPCQAGGTWQLAWQNPGLNYSIDAPLHFTGEFRHALSELFRLYQDAQTPLYAAINSTQCVVHVSDRPGD